MPPRSGVIRLPLPHGAANKGVVPLSFERRTTEDVNLDNRPELQHDVVSDVVEPVLDSRPVGVVGDDGEKVHVAIEARSVAARGGPEQDQRCQF